jgi:hypothetical protein
MANKKTLDKKKQLQHSIRLKISLVMLLIMSLKEPL